MRIYISGPIAGKPDGNRAAFQDEAKWVAKLSQEFVRLPRNRGPERQGPPIESLHPVNPHDLLPHKHDGGREACPPGYLTPEESPKHSTACYIRADLIALLFCDKILLIDGWGTSRGSKMERRVAEWSGIPIFSSRRMLVETLFGEHYEERLETL